MKVNEYFGESYEHKKKSIFISHFTVYTNTYNQQSNRVQHNKIK